MIVRIRLQRGPSVRRSGRKNQHVSLAVATLLSPFTLAACVLGLWRLAADLGVAGQFAIQDGLFSHWQVWIGIGGLVQLLSMALNRYGNATANILDSEQKAVETILNSGF